MRSLGKKLTVVAVCLVALVSCLDNSGRELASAAAQSCMTCHNGSQHNDYAGPGLENPHPFPGADNLTCTTCHGGNPNGADRAASHVPAPPEIGDREQWEDDDFAYFNRLTLTGLDKLPDYQANGQTYTALDYLQFVNPGDLRVAIQGRACGQCHQSHADCVVQSPLATETGILSGAAYSFGLDNKDANTDFQNTAADMGFRAVTDPDFSLGVNEVGPVASLSEYPVYSERGVIGNNQIHNNRTQYIKAVIEGNQLANNQVVSDSPLAHLLHEQVAYTCGDCHLGSAGANNRYGDFRSSGCTACHMQYSLDGRSGSRDPNVPKNEPLDPDDIDEPELSHVRAHRINSVAKTLPNGETQLGIDDYACAGCHQGSNRTVMQFWGIRLDQNQDVHRGNQYPDDPIDFETTRNDPRLFDPVVGNNTFNGRNHRQYLLFEDYDGDGKDDTPADVHYEAGMGCIDCHGSHDLHGGDPSNPSANKIMSRMEQAVAIQCEDCHGTISTPANTTMGQTYAGVSAEIGVDSKGNEMRHVVKEADGYFLYSRLTGNRHYIPQTHDTVVDNGVINPISNLPVYNKIASYAMGRDDGSSSTGIGPQQQGCTNCSIPNFSHTDNMSCVACHASWTNTCMGCHLEGEYRGGNEFSNITGAEITFREKNADFVYQSPVFFQLGINAHGKITQVSSNTKTFFKYFDIDGQESKVFAFTDRNGNGNNPSSAFRALGHNAIMAHSIRGRVASNKEGPRYCAACHLTDEGLTAYGGGNYATGVTNYQNFISDMTAGNYASLPFNQLSDQIGMNPGNEKNSPLFVHMVAGLGSGLFLFDQHGCAVNPLDTFANRVGCDDAPANVFATQVGNVVFNLDRVVEWSGAANASSNHPMIDSVTPNALRNGATNQFLAGPLGFDTIQLLAHPTLGVVLDSWIDTDRQIRGQAGNFIP